MEPSISRPAAPGSQDPADEALATSPQPWPANELVALKADWLFERLHAKGVLPLTLLWVLPLFVGGLVLVSFASATPVGWPTDWSSLLRIVPGVHLVAAAEQLPMPLLADVISLRFLVLIAAGLVIQYAQLTRFSRLIGDMRRNEIARIDDSNAFEIALLQTNRVLARWGRWRWPFAVSAALMSWMAHAQATSGFAPTPPGTQVVPYSGWWAATENFPMHFAYLLIGSFGMYYVLMQNYVGVAILRFFWKQRRNISYRLNAANPDGAFGWSCITAVLWTVLISIVIHAIALGTIVSLVPASSLGWVTPLIGLFVLLNPCYVIVPLVLFRRQLRRHKAALIDHYQTELSVVSGATVNDGVAASRIETTRSVRQEIHTLRVFSVPPFAGKRVIIGWVAYVLAAGGALAEISAAFR